DEFQITVPASGVATALQKVEGEETSQNWRDVNFKLIFNPSKTNYKFDDEAVATVIRTNIDLFKSDNKAKLDQNKEIKQGGFRDLNNEDENRNGIIDRLEKVDDSDGKGGEDDLLRLHLDLPDPAAFGTKGLLTLRVVNAADQTPSDRVRIWDDPQRGSGNL